MNRKSLLLAALLPVVACMGTGCSGINSSHGVSPASFLLPGFFGQTPPPAPAPVQEISSAPETEPVQAFALSH